MVNNNDSHYGYNDQAGMDSRGDGGLVTNQDKRKLSMLANDAVKKGANAMGDAEIGKTEKFLGMNVDAGLAAYLSSIYNIASDNIAQFIAPKTYGIAEDLAVKGGLTAKSVPLARTATAVTVAVVAGLKSAGEISKITAVFSEQKQQRKKLVHSIAPVLDDIKGRHSVGAFASVSEKDNEVIYAHRQRLSRINKSENTNKIITMLVNVAPNVALDMPFFKKMWGGWHPDQSEIASALTATQVPTAPVKTDDSSFGNLGRTFVQASTGQLADRITKSNDMKLRKGLQPYSALEMILELQQQVESNPKASSFQAPKGFENSNRHPESYPLEEYLALMFIQHQREMADLKDDHTEIREALHEDLTAAVKPIATAIRAGNLSVMALVRLVGEREIIKNRGRAIAEPKEVEALIKGSSAYVHTDLEEYYRNSPTTREEKKKLLGKLEGDERFIFLSLHPTAVMKDLGVSDKEIKEVVEKSKKNDYKQTAELLVGVHQESQSALKKDGLAKPEIQILDSAYEAIKREGVGALAEFKTSPTNPKGVEKVLADWAVPHIKGGEHLGKVIEKGHAKLASMTAEMDQEADETRDLGDADLERGSHATRQKSRADVSRGASAELD